MKPYCQTGSSEKKTISVYDFDETITHRDSFVPFLRHAFGNKAFHLKMLSLFIPTLRYLFGKKTRNELKEELVAKFMVGVSEEWVSIRSEFFLKDSWDSLINKEALSHIEYDLQRGFEVTICSASPEIVLAPFAKKLGVNLIGTRLEDVDGILTGKLLGKNCRADEKVERLKEKYGNLDIYHIISWGDSPGDYDLLNISQEKNWRPFRGGISIPPDFKREIEIRNIKQKQVS